MANKSVRKVHRVEVVNNTTFEDISKKFNVLNETIKTVSDSHKLGRVKAYLNGALDGIEFDNTSDVIEKTIVLDFIRDALDIVENGSIKSLEDKYLKS